MPDKIESDNGRVTEIVCRKCSRRYKIRVIEEPVTITKLLVGAPEYEWRKVRTDSFPCKCGRRICPRVTIWIDKTDPSPHLKIAWFEEVENKNDTG